MQRIEPLFKNTIRDGGSTAQIIGFLGLVIELLKCISRCLEAYMRKKTFVAETVIWAKKNWRKIWPKNGLKWPKMV